jgi:hypothetical protein
MTTAVQRRRGTTTEHASFTGLEGEISVNTTKDTLVVHDGSTAGGFELARADGSNFVATSVDINGGSIDGTTIGASSASTGAFTTLTASGEITANGGIALGDNDKATFGDSDDLQVYHDGFNSYITDTGTGNLYVRASNELALTSAAGEAFFLGIADGSSYLYHSGGVKLNTTATGIDVTGTATMDGLTVDGESDLNATLTITHANPRIKFIENDSVNSNTQFSNDAGDFAISTMNDAENVFTKRFNLDHATGDISFYEDTGTTPKLFWDASAESLGIGTTSPSEKLQINDGRLRFLESGQRQYNIGIASGTPDFQIYDATFSYAPLTITGAGNVGIGISSGLTYPLTVKSDANNSYVHFVNSTTGSAFSDGSQIGVPSGSIDLLINNRESGNVRLNTSNTERMRIDSAGNVGIGTSSPARPLEISDATSDGTGGVKISSYLPTFEMDDISAGGTSLIIQQDGANTLFKHDTTERMRIDSAGNLLVNTANSPTTTKAVISSDYSAVGTTNTGLTIAGRQGGNWYNNGIHALGASGLVFSTGTTGVNGADATNERMRIDSAGNVGIGTSSPNTLMEIASTSPVLRITNTTDATWSAGQDIGRLSFYSTDPSAVGPHETAFILNESDFGSGVTQLSGALSFGTAAYNAAATERMRIDSSGRVGIGVVPSAFLLPNGSTGALQLQGGGLLSAYNASTYLSQNWYYNAGEKYIANGSASRYAQTGAEHVWSSAGNNTSGAGAGLSWQERMRIDSSGNVGIGISSPTGAKLRVVATEGSNVLGVGTTTQGLFIKTTGTTVDYNSSGNVSGEHTFSTGNLERMRIDVSGNLLVGTTSAIGRLTVVRSGVAWARSVDHSNAGTQYFDTFRYSGNETGSITGNNTSTSYNTSSDERLKENIADADDAGSKIDAIQVRQYDWKADGSHQDYGMIAQELQLVAPEAVSGDADSEEMMGVDYSKLVPMLIKEIQSLRNRVAQLEE